MPALPGRYSGRRSGDAQDVVGSKEAELQRTVLARGSVLGLLRAQVETKPRESVTSVILGCVPGAESLPGVT